MKPAELFLDVRRFFGALVPGCIWTTAIGLLIWADSLDELLRWREWTGIVVASYLGISFLVGFVVQPVSFGVATWVASSPLLDNRVVSRLRWGRDRWSVEVVKSASRVATAVIAEHYPGVAEALAGNGSEDHDGRREGVVFELCKRIVLERSDRLGKKLEDYEAEINLLGSVPLPLSILTVAFFLRAHQFADVHFSGTALTWSWLVPIVCLAIVCVALFTLGESRAAEKRVCFEAFLALEKATGGEESVHEVPPRP